LNEIASSYGIHPTQLRQWEKQVLESVSDVFTDIHNRSRKTEEDLVDCDILDLTLGKNKKQ